MISGLSPEERFQQRGQLAGPDRRGVIAKGAGLRRGGDGPAVVLVVEKPADLGDEVGVTVVSHHFLTGLE